MTLAVTAWWLGCGAVPQASRDPVLDVELRFPVSHDLPTAGHTITIRDGTGAVVAQPSTGTGGRVTLRVPAGRYEAQVNVELTVDAARTATGHAVAHTLAGTTGVLAVQGDTTAVLTPVAPPLGGLVFKQVYWSGSPGLNGAHYFHDQFVELHNNATHPITLDGLCLADVFGVSGDINGVEDPSPYQSDPAFVYVENIWCFPAHDPPQQVAPGQSILVVQDGANHQPDSPLDFSGASYEAFNQRADERDVDWPTVENLTRVSFSGGYDWLWTVFGPGLILFDVPDPAALESVITPDGFWEVVKVPSPAVLEAVEALMDANSGRFKRIPASQDASFIHVGGTYTLESVVRRVAATIHGRPIYQDTQDSAADFLVQSPPTQPF